ncbi:hypothetical protein EON64_12135 [archaeon]|nr:MAG: hypothetical protein EON64_12135 [archaeon]
MQRSQEDITREGIVNDTTEEIIIEDRTEDDRDTADDSNSDSNAISLDILLQQFSSSSRFANLRNASHTSIQQLLPDDDHIYSFEDE